MVDPKELDYTSFLNKLASRLPDPASEYYAMTLTGNKHGDIVRSIYSQWVGYADKEYRIEIRKASLIRAEIAVARWREAGQRCLVVNNSKDLQLFFLAGGHAVIEENISRLEIGEWLKPEQVVRDGVFGFASVCDLPSNFQKRAPSPKLRMQVLKRDGYGCRICGRRPADNVDIELHVHHIRPWANRGVLL